jgi:hypothetical protein
LLAVKRVRPGLYFFLPTDLGIAVGVVTHLTQGSGDVIWLAEPMFDEEPALDEAASIREWRWPILLTVGPAIHQKAIYKIGCGPVPDEIGQMPVFRFGDTGGTWRRVSLEDGVPRMGAITDDPSIPIWLTVNAVALREHLVSGWTPQRWW